MTPIAGLRNRWRQALIELEKGCPWAGPRPLTRAVDGSAPYRFVEREQDARRFLDVVRSNRLVVLHGESGAGKSSLLDMVLIDRLFDDGFAVLTCRAWGRLGNSEPEAFLTDEFRRSNLLHPLVVEQLDEGRPLVEVLDELYEGDAVIVLDQFEELIRNRRPGDFDRITQWILHVNRAQRTKVVISLRSEYQHRLAALIKGARPFSTSYVELPALQDTSSIVKVIESANERAEGQAIEAAASAALLEVWTELATSGRPYGLLAVQAALYSLYYRARRRLEREGGGATQSAAVVTLADVLDLKGAADAAAPASMGHVDVFSHSFDEAIELRLAHCMDACSGLGLPESFVHSTRGCVVDAAQHLSSGDYKLEREIGDLLVRSKDRDFRLTGWPRDESKRGAVALIRKRDEFDYLRSGRDGLAQQTGLPQGEPPSGAERARFAEQGVYPMPWLDDPRDVSAGPMLAFPTAALLLEQLRAFTFAIDWLVESYLLRVTSSEDALTVSLIHDGFGQPLEAWAGRLGLSTWAATSSVVAYEGQRFDWGGVSGAPLANEHGAPRHLVNLRWRNCRVDRATFEHVVFVNCDFRGVTFEGCRFEGVTFVNCLLDSASFDWCIIVGASDIRFDFDLGAADPVLPPAGTTDVQGPGNLVTDMPDFVLADSIDQVVTDLLWFRGGDASVDCLYSPTSGVAAVPWWRARDRGVPFVRQPAGVAMYGGRLSSLMIKDCRFERGPDGQDPSIALCHMAGSSLDLVEQGNGRVHLYYSAIRGLAVTNKVESERRSPEEALYVRAHECVLVSAFFGEGLRGNAQLRASKVLGVSNASDEAFLVEVEDSRAADGDNVLFRSDVMPLDGFGTGSLSRAAQQALAGETGRLAYRSVPARLEVERRVREDSLDGAESRAAGHG